MEQSIRIGLNEHSQEPVIFCRFEHGGGAESDVLRRLQEQLKLGRQLRIRNEGGSMSFSTFSLGLTEPTAQVTPAIKLIDNQPFLSFSWPYDKVVNQYMLELYNQPLFSFTPIHTFRLSTPDTAGELTFQLACVSNELEQSGQDDVQPIQPHSQQFKAAQDTAGPAPIPDREFIMVSESHKDHFTRQVSRRYSEGFRPVGGASHWASQITLLMERSKFDNPTFDWDAYFKAMPHENGVLMVEPGVPAPHPLNALSSTLNALVKQRPKLNKRADLDQCQTNITTCLDQIYKQLQALYTTPAAGNPYLTDSYRKRLEKLETDKLERDIEKEYAGEPSENPKNRYTIIFASSLEGLANKVRYWQEKEGWRPFEKVFRFHKGPDDVEEDEVEGYNYYQTMVQ